MSEMLLETRGLTKQYGQLKKGDRFLICSDGVSDMVSIEFLETMLLQTQSPAKCVNTILTAALEAGGKDNITAIVLEINR